jgi:hypothetical protein
MQLENVVAFLQGSIKLTNRFILANIEIKVMFFYSKLLTCSDVSVYGFS